MAMGLGLLTKTAVIEASVQSLGLDSGSLDFDAPETLAAVIRRTASFRCPIGVRSLIDATIATVGDLTTRADLRPQLVGLLQAMIGCGDLIELMPPFDQSAGNRLIYLAPPTFVRTLNGTFVLLGVRPENAPLVDEGIRPFIQYERHTRIISGEAPASISAMLEASGLHEVEQSRWLRSPGEASAASIVAQMNQVLAATSQSGDVAGLQILDSSTPVDYYRGRWRNAAGGDTGRFVARREQAYGADLWCYVRVANGATQQLVDLPSSANFARGCDEAWRLQAAIDANEGHPERFRIARSGENHDVISMFAPPPSWLQRRWDGRGLPVAARGALVSYVFASTETPGEAEFLNRMLWLEEVRYG